MGGVEVRIHEWLMEEEGGQGLVEYAFILIIVSVAAVGLLKEIGTIAARYFNEASGYL